jgi:hypothetical protein
MPEATSPTPLRRSLRNRIAVSIAFLLLAWAAIAYLMMPDWWRHYVRRHPQLEDIPRVTHAKDGLPGDPLNVALAGTQTQVMKIMVGAKWYPSDPLTLRSCLEIAEATVLRRPYETAPVSNLYLFDRKEDLAFEHPVGNDPRKRHHVRFWKTEKLYGDGRPIWVGAAIYDEHVGLSKTTGQITHVTAADIDAESNKLFHDLAATGELEESYFIDGFHTVLQGKNGGGDPWHTDGRLEAGIIKLT